MKITLFHKHHAPLFLETQGDIALRSLLYEACLEFDIPMDCHMLWHHDLKRISIKNQTLRDLFTDKAFLVFTVVHDSESEKDIERYKIVNGIVKP